MYGEGLVCSSECETLSTVIFKPRLAQFNPIQGSRGDDSWSNGQKEARSRRGDMGAKPPEMAKQNGFTAGESELAVQRRQWLFGLLSLQTYQAGK